MISKLEKDSVKAQWTKINVNLIESFETRIFYSHTSEGPASIKNPIIGENSFPSLHESKKKKREREEEESMHQEIWKIMLQERNITDSSNWKKQWSPISYA